MKINMKMINSLTKSLLIRGDTFRILPRMEANIFDSSLLDIPYGIGILGKEWDNFSPEAISRKTANHKNIDHKKQSGRSASMHAGQYDLGVTSRARYHNVL